MRIRHLWIATLAASAAVTAGAAPARASSAYPVAVWRMDEPAGSRIMRDSSGNGVDGRIGREVGAGIGSDTSGAFRFGRLDPDTPPTHPEHLVVVPDGGGLDPGTRDFAVTVRLRTTYQFGNVIQKGQATVAGGSYKIQIPGGKVQCWFRGSAGQLLVTGPRAINDGRWHTVSCTRTQEGLSLVIDGAAVAGKRGATGRIANGWPISIGGKTNCDQVSVGCDYFAGDLDYVQLYAADDDW